MKKKLFGLISFSHIFLTVAFLFPIIRISESKVGIGGSSNNQTDYINIFRFASYDIYSTFAIMMIVLLVIEILAFIHSFYVFATKKFTDINTRIAFVFSFSSAIMGALQISTRSLLCFFFCLITFAISSVSSIILLKSEN